MGLWNFYFLGKLYLYFRGFIRIDFLWNLLFIIYLILPVPKGFRFYKQINFAKSIFGIIFGLLLLWHDSWLPPILYSINSLVKVGMPTGAYIYRFLLGFFNPWELAIISAILAFFIMLRNRIRLTTLVLLLMLIVPIREYGQSTGEMDRYLDSFYRSESQRVIRYKDTKVDNPDFDIVILHICSLSWDDLKGAGMNDHPFFKQFDYLFTNFNSVTSYSNPSAIRLLRSNCGQSRHDDLYNETPKDCYLFGSLRERGYETYFTMNHDGRYDHFTEELKKLGGLDKPIVPKEVPVQAYSFDGSAIFDNYTELEKVWKIRQGSNPKRAAIYYNTVSLHEGAHWAEDKDWWKRDIRMEGYKGFLHELLGDLTKFFDLLSSSGRNIVILFVPEHGMALRASPIQAPGLRDIPLPQITRVPVGIKFIGKGYDRTPANQKTISKPISYLALSYLLEAFTKQSPFDSERSMDKGIIDKIPQTDFVSENQGIQLVKKDGGYFLLGKEKKWVKLPDNAVE